MTRTSGGLRRRRRAVNTSLKGRRFEYYIRDMLRRCGYVVVRLAASKPWDLVASNNLVTYAVECKLGSLSRGAIEKAYTKLVRALACEDGERCAMVPLLFYCDRLGRVRMFTEAVIHRDGVVMRPLFLADKEKLVEVIAVGDTT